MEEQKVEQVKEVEKSEFEKVQEYHQEAHKKWLERRQKSKEKHKKEQEKHKKEPEKHK
jgi:hypothetical protein